jgi:hypothetical protein
METHEKVIKIAVDESKLLGTRCLGANGVKVGVKPVKPKPSK